MLIKSLKLICIYIPCSVSYVFFNLGISPCPCRVRVRVHIRAS